MTSIKNLRGKMIAVTLFVMICCTIVGNFTFNVKAAYQIERPTQYWIGRSFINGQWKDVGQGTFAGKILADPNKDAKYGAYRTTYTTPNGLSKNGYYGITY